MPRLVPAVGVALVLMVAATFAPLRAEADCSLPRRPVRSDAAAIERARQAIQVHRLSTLKPECIDVELFSKERAAYLVEAREVHSAVCGGAPQTAPRLFLIRVGVDGRMASDAGRLDGTFGALRCPSRRSDEEPVR